MQRRVASGAPRIGRVPDVVLERRALLGLVLLGLAQRLDVDRRGIAGRRDGARQEGAVVVAVVPGEAALVVRVLPEAGHELDRVDGRLAVERDLAVTPDLRAAPR